MTNAATRVAAAMGIAKTAIVQIRIVQTPTAVVDDAATREVAVTGLANMVIAPTQIAPTRIVLWLPAVMQETAVMAPVK